MDKYTKQPADIQDYDLSFVDWLAAQSDTGQSIISTVISGPDSVATITSPAPTLSAGVIKVWVTAGTDGASYKITATLQTVGGRRKQHEILVKVKEI
jgi:hypothetical protein